LRNMEGQKQQLDTRGGAAAMIGQAAGAQTLETRLALCEQRLDAGERGPDTSSNSWYSCCLGAAGLLAGIPIITELERAQGAQLMLIMLEDPSDQEKKTRCGSQNPGGWPYLRKTLPEGPPVPSIDPTEWATLVQQFNTALGPPGAGFEFGGWKSGCSVLSFVAFVACIPTFYQWSLDGFCGNCVIFSITFGGLFVVAMLAILIISSYAYAAAKAQRNQAYARWNNAIQSWNQVHRGHTEFRHFFSDPSGKSDLQPVYLVVWPRDHGGSISTDPAGYIAAVVSSAATSVNAGSSLAVSAATPLLHNMGLGGGTY